MPIAWSAHTLSCSPTCRRTTAAGPTRALFDASSGSGSSAQPDGHRPQQHAAIQQAQPLLPPPVLASATGATGSQQQLGWQQHASIQHPLFPQMEPSSAVPLPVQTQRGIPKFQPVIESGKPCPHCGGTGKVTCGDCRGKGRLNYRGASMLPQGAWPQWCPACRASGRWHCAPCMGTGVKRSPMGFRLPHEDDGEEE